MIDHLVYATPDLAGTVADLRRRCGVTLGEGGPHLGLGTRNMLADLGGGAYLEVIGPDDGQPEPAVPRPFGVDALTAPALVAWAIRVDGIDEVVERARARGHDPGRPAAMSRRRPDGVLLEWRLTPPVPGVLPFLIDWGSTPHPSHTAATGMRLASFTVLHPDPGPVRRAMAALDQTPVVREADQPGLEAVLATPAGEVVLR